MRLLSQGNSQKGCVTLTALPATDNFNRANGGLGTNWSTITSQGAPLIKNTDNVSTNVTGVDSYARWNADSFADDQYAKITVDALDTASDRAVYGVVRAASAAATFYAGGGRGPAGATATANIRKCVTTTVTNLTSTTKTINLTDVLKIEVIGTTGTNLTLYINDVSSITASDNAIATGSAGCGAFVDSGADSGALLDNWEGGNVSAAAFDAATFPAMLMETQGGAMIGRACRGVYG